MLFQLNFNIFRYPQLGIQQETSDDLRVCLVNSFPKVSIMPSSLTVNLTKVEI